MGYANFRYLITTFPIKHINGKLANSDTIVKNKANTNVSDTSFYYGYQKKHSEKSFFGLREKARNLSVNPYTTEELKNRDKFKLSCDLYYHNRDIDNLQKPFKEWEKNNEGYKTFKGYCIGKTRINNAVWVW